jgi:hypothetical protein
MAFFCGIEGGATNTTCVILDSACKVLGRSAGSGSNHYLIGMPAVSALLAGLARAALKDAGLPDPSSGSAPAFAAFGACMSGFLEAGPQAALEAMMREEHPWLASSYYIDNDSPGSIYTAAGGAGGCVLIAGTGSMGQLMTSSGATVNCGGNGHMYGDGACPSSLVKAIPRLSSPLLLLQASHAAHSRPRTNTHAHAHACNPCLAQRALPGP